MNSDFNQCDNCGKMVHVSELNEGGHCPTCAADDLTWAEDERDMARIKREWDAYDRDPPGS